MVTQSNRTPGRKPSATRLFDSVLTGSVKDSAQQIWLAGLGAFARAQAEGTKVFEALVHEGTSLQRKTQAHTEEKITQVTGKLSAVAGDVQAKAGMQWDRLESIFEERTAKALQRLGVPSARDVEALTQRIDALSTAVAELQALAKPPAARRPAAKKAAAKKAAAKKAPSRELVAKRGVAKRAVAVSPATPETKAG